MYYSRFYMIGFHISYETHESLIYDNILLFCWSDSNSTLQWCWLSLVHVMWHDSFQTYGLHLILILMVHFWLWSLFFCPPFCRWHIQGAVSASAAPQLLRETNGWRTSGGLCNQIRSYLLSFFNSSLFLADKTQYSSYLCILRHGFLSLTVKVKKKMVC